MRTQGLQCGGRGVVAAEVGHERLLRRQVRLPACGDACMAGTQKQDCPDLRLMYLSASAAGALVLASLGVAPQARCVNVCQRLMLFTINRRSAHQQAW